MSRAVDDALKMLALIERDFPGRPIEELVVLLAATLGAAIGAATWPEEPAPMVVACGTLVGKAVLIEHQRRTMAGCAGTA